MHQGFRPGDQVRAKTDVLLGSNNGPVAEKVGTFVKYVLIHVGV